MNSRVSSANIYGDVERSEFWKRHQDSLESFLVKSPNGDLVRFKVLGDSVSVRRYDDNPTDHSSEDVPELGVNHYLGVCVMVSFQAVDEYIERNGLRPVVDEVKRRRWVIMMGLALFAALH